MRTITLTAGPKEDDIILDTIHPLSTIRLRYALALGYVPHNMKDTDTLFEYSLTHASPYVRQNDAVPVNVSLHVPNIRTSHENLQETLTDWYKGLCKKVLADEGFKMPDNVFGDLHVTMCVVAREAKKDMNAIEDVVEHMSPEDFQKKGNVTIPAARYAELIDTENECLKRCSDKAQEFKDLKEKLYNVTDELNRLAETEKGIKRG